MVVDTDLLELAAAWQPQRPGRSRPKDIKDAIVEPDWDGLRGRLTAHSVSDDEIRVAIKRDFARLGQTWCPHTATAACVYERLGVRRAAERWVLVATAHPAKFNDIVEPLIGTEVPVPPALAALLALPSVQTEIGPEMEELRTVLGERA